jgi:hypothetical protein
MSFNTLYSDLNCPICGAHIESGIGFQVGAIENRNYKVGEKLNWKGATLRPETRPNEGRLRTIGYFNCDNVNCDSWKDCYPDVQNALIEIEDDVIVRVSVYNGVLSEQKFEILDPFDYPAPKEI